MRRWTIIALFLALSSPSFGTEAACSGSYARLTTVEARPRHPFLINAAYQALLPIGIATRFLMAPFSARIRKGIWDRVGLLSRVRAHTREWDTQPIWVHVASNGELEQAIPIMEQLKAQYGGKIFLSFASPNGKRAAMLEEQRRKSWGAQVPWDYADYLCYDLKSSVKAYVKAINPSQFISIYREIWPNLLTELKEKQVPTHLFATHFSPKARAAMPFYSTWLRLFDTIGTVNEDNRDYLRQQFPGKAIEAHGEPRIDRVISRRDRQPKPAWAPEFQGKKVLILGSVWNKDFDALKDSLSKLLSEHPDWRIVIAPHFPEPDNVKELQTWFQQQGKPARLWTDWLRQPDRNSPIIVNNVGQLADLYTVADVVFVGGSFGRRVHSVLEPAAYGKPVLTGPDITNSQEAMEMSVEPHGLGRMKSGSDLIPQLMKITASPETYDRYAKQSLKYLLDRQGADRRYSQAVGAGGER